MGRVLKTPDAEVDLIEIWLHISEDSPRAADRLWAKFQQTFDLLSNHPRMGPQRPELAPDLRSFPVGNYLVFYRPLAAEEGIAVIRVLHGARELRHHFRGGARPE